MVKKQIKTLRGLKQSLKKTLPAKISEVIAGYEIFAGRPVPDDAKGFNAHHSACKAAVIHAETLLKLARWTEEGTDISSETNDQKTELQYLLDEAHREEEDFDDEQIE